MRSVKKGATDQTFMVKMIDSATGTPKTALTITAIDITYVRNRAAASKTDATALGSVTAAHADNQAIEVDATNAPGLYRVDFPDAAFATGVDDVVLVVTCTGCDPAMMEIPLIDNSATDVYTRLGAPAGASIAADIAQIYGVVDTEVAAIKAKTDNLPSDPADASDIAASFATVNSTLGTIAGYIDTEVAAIFNRIGAPVGASISADIAAIQADTDNIQTRIPAALVSGRIDCSVGAMAANVLTATAINADAFTAAKFASDVGAEFADAVWDEALSGHLTGGSTGNALNAAGSAGDPWATTLPGAYTGSQAGSILPAIAGYIDTEVAAIKAKTDNLPVDPADASDIAAAFSTVNGTLSTIASYIDTEVAAIKAKTDNLPVDPADASDINASFTTVNNALTAIAGYIDTEVAAIKVKTDNLPASPAAVGDIPSANANADALLDRAAGVETGWTLRQSLRIMLSVLAGKANGLGTATANYRDMADTKNRIVATVDVDGNRTAVTRDAA